MDWVAVWMDVGLLIAGALAAWVPADFCQSFFLVSRPVMARIWGPIVGPLAAVIAFVCSVGNIPLAAVLWNGGISFGGVIAFIFCRLDRSSNSKHLSKILRDENCRFISGTLMRGASVPRFLLGRIRSPIRIRTHRGLNRSF
jgi:hypothetical protein